MNKKIKYIFALLILCGCDTTMYHPQCKPRSESLMSELQNCFEWKISEKKKQYCDCVLNACVYNLDFRQCEKKANIS